MGLKDIQRAMEESKSKPLLSLDHKKLRFERKVSPFDTLPFEVKALITFYIASGQSSEICEAVRSWCETNKHSYDNPQIWEYALQGVGVRVPTTEPRELFQLYCEFATKMATAAKSGNVDKLKDFLHSATLLGTPDDVKDDAIEKALSIAADSEQEEAFRELATRYGRIALDVLKQAAMDGNKTFLRMFFNVYKDEPYVSILLAQMLLVAGEAGQLNIVEWILETYSHAKYRINEHVRTSLYLTSAQRNQFHIVQWIQQQEDQDSGTWGMHHEDVVGQVMILCAKKGRLDLVQWSYNYFLKYPEETGREFIVDSILEARGAGHTSVANWLEYGVE